MKLGISRQIFEIYSHTKFHENPSSGSQLVPCGRTDMTELRVPINNVDNQLDATITDLLIIPISSTCFGQLFAHPQER